MATVLVVEDNPQNRYLVTFLLEQRGYRVAAAESGDAAVAAALASNPDLILLDIQLPGMDGYAVARALRSHGALRTIPIIAVTSFAMTGDREASLAAGCTGYVEKPIDPDSFVSEIERYLAPGTMPRLASWSSTTGRRTSTCFAPCWKVTGSRC